MDHSGESVPNRILRMYRWFKEVNEKRQLHDDARSFLDHMQYAQVEQEQHPLPAQQLMEWEKLMGAAEPLKDEPVAEPTTVETQVVEPIEDGEVSSNINSSRIVLIVKRFIPLHFFLLTTLPWNENR